MEITTVTNGDLAQASIVIVAGVDITADDVSRLLAACNDAGVDPLVVIIDDHRNLRFITATQLAESAVVLLAHNQWAPYPERTRMFGDIILSKAKAAGTRAPMMVTTDNPANDVTLAVTNTGDARQIVDYLTERFDL